MPQWFFLFYLNVNDCTCLITVIWKFCSEVFTLKHSSHFSLSAHRYRFEPFSSFQCTVIVQYFYSLALNFTCCEHSIRYFSEIMYFYFEKLNWPWYKNLWYKNPWTDGDLIIGKYFKPGAIVQLYYSFFIFALNYFCKYSHQSWKWIV